MSWFPISDEWQYFIQQGEGNPICKYCKRKIKASGGTTANLIRHLKLVHHTKFSQRSSTSTSKTDNSKEIDLTTASSSNNKNEENNAISAYFLSNKLLDNQLTN